MKERGHKRLARIFKRDRRVILPQITADFIAGASTNVRVRTVQSVIEMGLQSRRPTHVPLLTARHKALSLPECANTFIGLLMTENTLADQENLVST